MNRLGLVAVIGGVAFVAGGCDRAAVTSAGRDGAGEAGDAAVDSIGELAADAAAADAPGPDGGADGGADGGLIEATNLAVKASGNVVVTGVLRGAVDLGLGPLVSAGDTDLVVVEMDASGRALWNRRFGDAGRQGGALSAVDGAGNTWAATTLAGTLDLGRGQLTSAGGTDVALFKLDPTGTTVWSRRFGDADNQFPTGLAVSPSGDAFLQLHFGTGMPNEGTSIMKVSSSGDVAWTKSWLDVEARSLAPALDGGVLSTGWFWRTVDFGGGPLTSAGLEDVFVLALAPSGEWRWSKGFGGGGSDQAAELAVDPGGNLLVTGQFDDTLDFGDGAPLVSALDPSRFAPSRDVFVAKLGPGGAPIWSRRFGDATSDQEGTAIAADPAGGVLVLGIGGASIDFGLGALTAAGGPGFLARLDSDGRTVWQSQLGVLGATVRTAPSGAALLGGGFPGGASFGAIPIQTVTGGDDVFLVEYAAP